MSGPSLSLLVNTAARVDFLYGKQALAFESLRNKILKLFAAGNYELVMPALLNNQHLNQDIDFGAGLDLDKALYKPSLQPLSLDITELLKLYNTRADLTVQTAYLDARCEQYATSKVARMCYAMPIQHKERGSDLEHTTSTAETWYAGAELYGDDSELADWESLALMVNCARSVAAENDLYLNLGHIGVVHTLWENWPLTTDNKPWSLAQQEYLCAALMHKSHQDLQTLSDAMAPADKSAREFLQLLAKLMDLHGDDVFAILEQAEALFKKTPAVVRSALDDLGCLQRLHNLAKRLTKEFKHSSIYLDLSELYGYGYHTGLVFKVYANGCTTALANGGRCDHIGKAFGRYPRPAVGFSADLRLLNAYQYHQSNL